jgi:SAM-dependent methyltransferase
MAETQFGRGYASAYDAMYADKDYEAEVSLVEDAFGRFADGGPVRSVLDLGAGTGNHSLVLARRGYEVAGVDLSYEMVEIARSKAAEAGLDVEFRQGDLRTVDVDRRFDAVLLMFAVIGYQRTIDDVRAALANARRLLRTGGVLFFDLWYGPGVLSDPPETRERVIDTPEGPLTRRVTSELDVPQQLCAVHYALSGAGRDATETHIMRFFFPAELELFLEAAGFRLRTISKVDDLDRPAGTESWTATVVATAV